MTAELDVVIIGAGAAGVAAGRRLADANANVRIVEARDRIGGRGFTLKTPHGALDLGCGWLHSGDVNPWTEIATTQGADVRRGDTPWTRAPLQASLSPAENESFQAENLAFRKRLAEGAHGEPDRPVSAFLDPASRWNGLIGAVSTYASGAEPEKISARDLADYADTGVNWRVASGLGATIAAHGAGLPVTLGCRAQRVDHSGRIVRVETDRGTLEAKTVIVTLPSRLIAEGALTFAPELPEKRDAAAGLPLGLADKLYFSLDGAEEFSPDARAFGRPDRVATASYMMRALGKPLIECYFGGELAADLERGGARAFEVFAREELANLFGSDFGKRIMALPTHHWRGDPLAGGSYSYAAPGRAGDRARFAAPVDQKLFFAGEACSQIDYSTAHGAYRTGVAAAEAALAALTR